MPELRLNLVTREWVIIATERAKRPMDFRNNIERPAPPPHLSSCPFCPGNEHKTPEEQLRLPEDGGWKIRVVSNKYPALSKTGERKRSVDGFRRSMTGVGIHEIIVESSLHNVSIAFMELNHIQDVLRIYKNRFIEAHKDLRVEHVIIFKNQGEAAGTSIEHAHSQLVGTPVVPIQVRDRVQAALHFFDDTGECMICSILKKEREEGVRVVTDTDHFITFIPYAALSPFHTWIFPKRHSATFSSITEEEIKDLSSHLKTLLSKFYFSLDNPDYNYVIRSSRPQDSANEYCHWYFSIVPRITRTAGFELGSGMFINTSAPEESAKFLRSARTE
ncbi:MAG: galactose-1-phosphate uridylyltransferase [Deltaproteobacteria bacterium]|nr:galactose-1-phosphate uridylyltransferase [Deltaproteobacteria bacterium]